MTMPEVIKQVIRMLKFKVEAFVTFKFLVIYFKKLPKIYLLKYKIKLK